MFASAERIELAALWDNLTAGTAKIESWSHAEHSWSMVVSRRPKPLANIGAARRRRDIEILERALLSGGRKQVALDAGLSCSSIAVIMQSCFHYMGLSCLPSRIPGLLVAAAHARHDPEAKLQSSLSGRAALGATQTITVTRPDAGLDAWLAPAEHAVIHLLIEGMSYAEIAQARQTSVRTVANQVAAGFRRLDVSGRAELLCLLARWGLDAPIPPARRPSSLPAPSSKRVAALRPVGSSAAAQAAQCLSPSPPT